MFDRIQKIREAYKPDVVKFLMVGEAPPHKGNFFYHKEEKNKLTLLTMEVFETVFSVKYGSVEEFLEDYKDREFYLDDLCHYPIDNKQEYTPRERKMEHQKNIAPLAERLQEYQPQQLFSFISSTTELVRKSALKAGLRLTLASTVFPAYSHRNEIKYRADLEDWIQTKCMVESNSL